MSTVGSGLVATSLTLPNGAENVLHIGGIVEVSRTTSGHTKRLEAVEQIATLSCAAVCLKVGVACDLPSLSCWQCAIGNPCDRIDWAQSNAPQISPVKTPD